MKRFKYTHKVMYPPGPTIELVFTSNKIHLKYGTDSFYIYKKFEYSDNTSILNLEKLNLPTSKVESEYTMIDGWQEIIYIDSIKIMDLALFEEERFKVGQEIKKLLGFDIFEYCLMHYNDFLRENTNLIIF